jgi:hypothetical protein
MHDAVGQFILDEGIPLPKFDSPSFHEMVTALIHAPPGCKSPSQKMVSTTVLHRCKDKAAAINHSLRPAAMKMGCTLVTDGWTNPAGRYILSV